MSKKAIKEETKLERNTRRAVENHQENLNSIAKGFYLQQASVFSIDTLKRKMVSLRVLNSLKAAKLASEGSGVTHADSACHFLQRKMYFQELLASESSFSKSTEQRLEDQVNYEVYKQMTAIYMTELDDRTKAAAELLGIRLF